MTPKHPFAPRRPARLSLGTLLLAPMLILSPVQSAQAQESLFPTAKPTETTLTQAGQLERGGNYAEALVRVEKAIAEAPGEARPRFLKGVILMDMKRLDEAAVVFQELREKFPELPEPYNNLAVIRMAQGHFEEARNFLELAVLAYPGYATAHENLGDVYAKLAGEEYKQGGAGRKFQAVRDLIAPGAASSGKPSADLAAPRPAK